jgi:uncharacterized membrane protein YbhN (UPF0104 family)
MRSLFRYLLYLSLPFLLYQLYVMELLHLPAVRSWPLAVAAWAVLVGAFLASAVSWRRMLAHSGHAASAAQCVAGMGLSVFGKYVPGKVWMIVGRAAYLAEARGYPLARLSAISLEAQVVDLWVGLLLGALGLLIVGGLAVYGWAVLACWLGLSLIVFSSLPHRLVEGLVRRLARREVTAPKLSLRQTFRLLPYFCPYSLGTALGFYLLVAAVTEGPTWPVVGLGFPLAATLGTLVVLAPGGLAVREGLLTGYLALAGVPLAEATAIAVVARLWFMAGELAFFLCGLAAGRGAAPARPKPAEGLADGG